MPRILTLLQKYDVTGSFFIPAVAALLYPNDVRRIIDLGHEVGVHGWIHELNSKLETKDERGLMLRAADVIEATAGRRPVYALTL